MKNKVRILVVGAILIGSSVGLSSWKTTSKLAPTREEWKAPVSANEVKNPFKGNEEATAKGKKLFKQMCAVCHGAKGKGDGVAGMSLTPRPTNFSTEKIQSQTDGSLFWKMSEGRSPMAAYKDMLKEEQRWELVNYIRTLKK